MSPHFINWNTSPSDMTLGHLRHELDGRMSPMSARRLKAVGIQENRRPGRWRRCPEYAVGRGFPRQEEALIDDVVVQEAGRVNEFNGGPPAESGGGPSPAAKPRTRSDAEAAGIVCRRIVSSGDARRRESSRTSDVMHRSRWVSTLCISFYRGENIR